MSNTQRPGYDLATDMVDVTYHRIMDPQEVAPNVWVERSEPLTFRDLLKELVREGTRLSGMHFDDPTDGDKNVTALPLVSVAQPKKSKLRLASEEGNVVSDDSDVIVNALGGIFRESADFIAGDYDAGSVLEIPASRQVAAEAFMAGRGRSTLVNLVIQEAMKDE